MLDKRDELRDRIEARARVKAQLDELESELKTGWQDITDAARAKLNKWLEKDSDKD